MPSDAFLKPYHPSVVFIDKLISVFVYPLGLCLAIGLLGLLVVRAGWRRTGVTFTTFAMLALWLASTPLVAAILAGALERPHPPVRPGDLPAADVAIVLGGGVHQPAGAVDYNLSRSADRMVLAARLWRAGKVKAILITGGGVLKTPGDPPESAAMRQFLVDLGVDAAVIVAESESRNTYENARLSKPIFDDRGFKSALLVTSALHMRRALQTFRAAGYPVTPASTDPATDTRRPAFPFLILPDVAALWTTTRAVKEVIGYTVYRYRGWL